MLKSLFKKAAAPVNGLERIKVQPSADMDETGLFCAKIDYYVDHNGDRWVPYVIGRYYYRQEAEIAAATEAQRLVESLKKNAIEDAQSKAARRYHG